MKAAFDPVKYNKFREVWANFVKKLIEHKNNLDGVNTTVLYNFLFRKEKK